jgi:tetratricopeptide (TPR) repeat protein
LAKAFREAWLAIALVIALAPSVAFAEAPSEAEIEAKGAMKRGMAAFARRDAETALAEYKKAQRLVPDANLPHRYAAEALVELERYEEAISEYETYLRIKPGVSDAAEIQKRIEAARAKIDGTIDVTSSPSGAEIFVDSSSTKAGITPLSGLRLRRGTHSIVARLAGRKDVTLSAVVHGGETLKFVANFAEESSRPTVVHEAAPAEASRPPRTLGWIALASGGVLLGGAAVLDTIVVPSKFDSFEDQRRRDDPAASGTLSDAHRLQVFSIVGYAAGGALAATGLVLLLWPTKSKAPPVKAGVGLGGAVFSGTF